MPKATCVWKGKDGGEAKESKHKVTGFSVIKSKMLDNCNLGASRAKGDVKVKA